MIIAKWKFDGMYNADAQKVAEEIYSIGEYATPQQILEKGRDENTELHRCFCWDDAEAAERYRLVQARSIARNLVIDYEKSDSAVPQTSVELRVLYKTSESEGYKRTELIVKNPDEHQNLLRQALRELRAFQLKYQSLGELEEVFEALDRVG